MAPTPLVSVVTPVHNGEAFLAECIESVLAQSYDRWEYTIVNNCSTDRSLEVAERYAQKDSRVRVISTERVLDVRRPKAPDGPAPGQWPPGNTMMGMGALLLFGLD